MAKCLGKMIPDWFYVGASVWFHGFGSEVKVIRIDNGEYHLDPDKEDGFWIGEDIEGRNNVSLDEVSEHWLPYHIDFRKHED